MKGFALALCLMVPSSPGQILGAYETFTDEDNAISWGRVDFADPDSASDALWRIPGSDNPEIYTTFNEDFETSLFADEISSDGAFVGDYDTAGIDVLRCDVYVQDLTSFDELEFYLLAGDTFYYSEIFELNEAGWALIETSLSKDEWYTFDDEDRTFDLEELTPEILSNIIEVGVTFYPKDGSANGRIVGVDNFALLPDLDPPALTVKPMDQQIEISFDGIKGIQYQLQANRSLRRNRWTDLGAPFENSGPYSTATPARNREFFRIIARPFFLEIP